MQTTGCARRSRGAKTDVRIVFEMFPAVPMREIA
jgi:hypothetical protein